MNKRTFDIIAKYISEDLGIKVIITNVPGPCMSVEKKEIYLPENIQERNALSALAVLMHEAAHLKCSSKIPIDDIVKEPIDHMILNAIEDVRIDRKNMRRLPAVKGFYEKYIQEHVCGE